MKILAALAILTLTGCTMSFHPDGVTDITVDAESAIRAFEIIATK